MVLAWRARLRAPNILYHLPLHRVLSLICVSTACTADLLANRMPSSSLQAKQKELERQQASDALRKGLAKRPERDELVESAFPPSSSSNFGCDVELTCFRECATC